MQECISDLISNFLIPAASLIAAIWIPTRIMKIQRFTNLLSLYMSHDFAQAYQGVINFYHDDCKCDAKKIAEKYYERYKKDFENNVNGKEKSPASILHYQRRYLNNYFYELEQCRRTSPFLRKEIREQFTRSEAYVAKILIYMNKASDENPEIYKDISEIKHTRMPRTKGMNIYLERIFSYLKDQDRWIK